MNKVILKHHEKEQKMSKKAKDAHAIRQFNLDKQQEQVVVLKTKIQDLAKERLYKARELDEKFKKANQKVHSQRQQIREYQFNLRENNFLR